MSKNKKNVIVEGLRIESIGFEGVAIARKDEKVHFVKGAVPGDLVNAQVRRKRKSYVETQMVELLEKSADRVDPICKYFGVCGGCSWQHLDYQKQLFWKCQNVKDQLQRIGKVTAGLYEETMPSVDIFNYRNKMEFSFGWSRWVTQEEIQSGEELPQKDFALGLHVPGRYDKIIDITECHIQNKNGNKILNLMRDKALELGVTAHNQRSHEGLLRNLVIRTTKANNELMVILVTNTVVEDVDKLFLEWFTTEFPDLCPEATNVMHALNDTKSPVAIGTITLIKGKEYITEEILGIQYRISPFSFFQTNPGQLDRFIGKILDYADIQESDIVWDLYCGTGSITLPAAKKAKKVYGIELVESSIFDANNNAQLNDISNVEFFCADLHTKETPDLLNNLQKPDVIIIDPPRAGLHKNIIPHIMSVAPEKLVYVSCNPSTQARDCEILSEIYDIEKVVPVDMFPHTFHVESIALLTKKSE